MHLEETRGFAADCKSVSSLVLDEAGSFLRVFVIIVLVLMAINISIDIDRLLDMGFKPDIDRIASYLSQQTDKVTKALQENSNYRLLC